VKRVLIRCTWIALGALTLAALAFVFHPNNWQYYTDGISLRQSAREADVRIVLWEEPEELVHDFNALTNNIEPVVSSDGRMMVFARGQAKKNADLYTAKWDGRRWSKPEPIDNINTPLDELGPELSDDLTLLYFYSDREGGQGNYDIWVSAWSGSYWDKPVNLGPAVNSPFNEYDPALTPGDDRLFFSSNRPQNLPDESMSKSWQATLRELVSQADYDIFRAQIMVGQVFTNQVSPGTNAIAYADWDPRSLGGVIPEFHPAERVTLLNTGQDEGQVDFTRRGDFIYFSSNREGGLGGFDIYRSRILESLFGEVERVGRPISSTADDMDPALWMEGHSLVFSSNRASDTGLDFELYQSTSREVFARFENARLAALWEWVKVNWWILLLMALGLAALWWLLKLFIDPAKRQSMDLLTRCVLASVLLHLILLFMLSLWFLSQVIVESTRGPMEIAVNDAALAREKVSLALREEVTKLKSARSDAPMEQKIERMELPDFEPAKQLTDLHFDTPVPHDFVVDYQPAKESEVPAKSPDAPDIQTELPAFAMEATEVRMETPDNKPVEASQSKPAKQPEQLDLTRVEELASTREEAQSSEAELSFAPPVIPDTVTRFEPDAAAPTVPMMEIPEIDLQGDLPTMDFVNNPEHMESREPQSVPEPMKSAVAVQPKALEVAYTPIEALVQDVAQPVPPALTVTQVVTQSALSSSTSTSELVADAPHVDIPSTQPAFEALELASERTLEAPETSTQAAPQEEQVIYKAETGALEPQALLPFTESPLALDSAIRSAPLPVPEPLSGTLLSLKDEIPEPLDSEGEETEWASDLPEFELGGTVSMESKPMEHMTYALRDPALREDFIEELGGNDQTEAAINRALQFLAQAQEEGGHWNIHRWGGEQGHDVAATGLALLCFMGHGAKHTEKGPYHDVASRAVRWLCDQLDDKGRFKAKDMYDQGIAAIAIAEAYALTRDPELLPHVESVVDYIIRAQHPKTGGWRYQPGLPGDTSVVGWQVMALKSALIGGVKVEDGVLNRASRWLKQVGGGKHGGHYGYDNKSPKPPMVAEGMFCQQLLGIPPSDRKMKESAKYLSAHLPNAREKDYYYWYYGCLSLYQHQGPIWKEWNERMREILINSQDRGGKDGGSWNPNGDPHGNRMGRIVSTALSTLSLEVYYRYLPMYSTEYGKN
jgi:hypothetical protein